MIVHSICYSPHVVSLLRTHAHAHAHNARGLQYTIRFLCLITRKRINNNNNTADTHTRTHATCHTKSNARTHARTHAPATRRSPRNACVRAGGVGVQHQRNGHQFAIGRSKRSTANWANTRVRALRISSVWHRFPVEVEHALAADELPARVIAVAVSAMLCSSASTSSSSASSSSSSRYHAMLSPSSARQRTSMLDVRFGASTDPNGGADTVDGAAAASPPLHKSRSRHSMAWGSPGFLKRGLRRWGSTGSWVRGIQRAHSMGRLDMVADERAGVGGRSFGIVCWPIGVRIHSNEACERAPQLAYTRALLSDTFGIMAHSGSCSHAAKRTHLITHTHAHVDQISADVRTCLCTIIMATHYVLSDC